MITTRSQIQSMGRGLVFKALILAISLSLWGSPAFAAENPERVVQNGTSQILNIIRQHPQDSPARREQVRNVIDQYFDFDAIARLAVGSRWRNLPPQKQQEFAQEFKKLLFNTYVGDIERYSAQRISYKQRSMAQDYTVVEMIVQDPSGPISLNYYLHLRDGNWKVYDVIVEGVSLLANYRNQFDTILANGSFDDLLATMRQKIAQICGSTRC